MKCWLRQCWDFTVDSFVIRFLQMQDDVHSSVNHLKICVSLRVFGAAIDLLRLEVSDNRLSRNDILQRLDKLYEDFTETPRRCQTLSQYVSYYLFVDYVLEEAIKYLVEVFRLNLSCADVHKHRPLFLRLRFTISLLEVVVDETKIQLNDENCSNETRDVCKKFLADLADLNVAYARNRPRYLRQAYLRNDDSAGRAGSGRRHSGKGVARRPSSVNATVSYVRRRNQQVTVDETLEKIDHFTDSWKKELEWRSSADGDETRSNLGQRAEEDGDDGRSLGGHSSTDSRVRRSAEPRDERERFRRPSPPAMVEPPLRLHQQQLHSLAGPSISPGPSEDRDLDFEKSVLAYRRAKQDERPSSVSRPQSRSVTLSGPSRGASSTNAESRPPNVSGFGQAEPSKSENENQWRRRCR